MIDLHEDALCAQVGPDLFFPNEETDTTFEAVKVCNMCDVREACLEDALFRGEQYGVWGGMTPRQRRKERRKRENTLGWAPLSGPGSVQGPGIDWVKQERIRAAGGGRWAPGRGAFVPVGERGVV